MDSPEYVDLFQILGGGASPRIRELYVGLPYPWVSGSSKLGLTEGTVAHHLALTHDIRVLSERQSLHRIAEILLYWRSPNRA